MSSLLVQGPEHHDTREHFFGADALTRRPIRVLGGERPVHHHLVPATRQRPLRGLPSQRRRTLRQVHGPEVGNLVERRVAEHGGWGVAEEFRFTAEILLPLADGVDEGSDPAAGARVGQHEELTFFVPGLAPFLLVRRHRAFGGLRSVEPVGHEVGFRVDAA